jgi:hypothetical protein
MSEMGEQPTYSGNIMNKNNLIFLFFGKALQSLSFSNASGLYVNSRASKGKKKPEKN